MENNETQNNELETLEDPGSDDTSPTPSKQDNPSDDKSPKPKKSGGLQKYIAKLKNHLNIYLLIFLVLLIAAITLSYISYAKDKNAANSTIKSQPLDQESLKNIQNSDISIGDAKQTLGIKSNTVFSGKVLVRDSLEVAGTIKVGGTLNLTGITVAGNSIFEQLQSNRLNLAGDATIQGQVNIQRNLVVGGSGTFSGPISAPQITIQSLQLSNDIQLNRHIDAGGPTPGKSDGNALGAGGTTSISGSDTAGTVAINIGGGPGAGCFVTVTFAQKFNGTPHVVITPVGASAASLNYYINRSSTNFSICSTNAAPAGSNFAFDFVAID